MTQQSNTARAIPILDRARKLELNDASADIKRRLARDQRVAREQLGLEQKEVAVACGLDAANLSRSELPHDNTSLNLRHLVLLARHPRARSLAVVMSQWLRDEVDPAQDRHGANDLARLASVTAESCQAQVAFTQSLADGDLDEAELELLVREFGELEQAAAEARGRFAGELKRRREAR